MFIALIVIFVILPIVVGMLIGVSETAETIRRNRY
jgi:hypothetical protein